MVAEVEQLEEVTLKEFILENKKNLNIIALEEVTDPRNIGSIIGSAVANNDGIIVRRDLTLQKVNFCTKVQVIERNILKFLKFQI